MRKRGMIGLVVVVLAILGWKAVSLAQRPAKPVALAMQLPEAKEEPKGWRSRAVPQVTGEAANPAMVPSPGPVTENGKSEAIAGDPMEAVDSFLDRNRKEAEDATQALTREAETLRARLQKVEAALARWQAVSAALNQKEISGDSHRDPRPVEVPPPSAPPVSGEPPLPTPAEPPPPGPAILPPASNDTLPPSPVALPEPTPAPPTAPADPVPLPSPR